MLAPITVNSLLDNTIGGDGFTTLREAINAANQLDDHDTITFDPAVFNTPKTITLTEGELSITKSLTIKGEDLSGNPLGITIDANGNDLTPDSTHTDGISNDQDGSTVFSMFSYGYGSAFDVTLQNLTITGADVPGDGGGINYRNHSGGSLNLFDVKLTDNHAFLGGGLSIDITGSETAPVEVRIERCEISGNTSIVGGGGVFINSTGGTLELIESTISGNTAANGRGGGIDASLQASSFNLSQSTIINNSALGNGGGFYASGNGADVKILGSTFSSNTSFSSTSSDSAGGGGLNANLTGGLLLIEQSNFVDMNTSTRNGGGLNVTITSGDLTIRSSNISGNKSQEEGGGLFAVVANTETLIEQSVFDGNKIEEGSLSLPIQNGGGINLKSFNSNTTISNTTISNNKALGDESNSGGANLRIDNGSTLLMDRVAVVGNHADDDVGGIIIDNDGSRVEVRNSTISGNTATHIDTYLYYDTTSGAYISTYGFEPYTLIENSLIVNNRTFTAPGQPKENVSGAGLGLAIGFDTEATVRNTTISGNQAEGSGGGIKIGERSPLEGGNVFIEHSTITNNSADSDGDTTGTGGGIHVGDSSTTVTLSHTIVAGNFRGTESTRSDIVGNVTANWSLVGDKTGSNLTEANPDTNGNRIGTGAAPIIAGLTPLAYRGGPTKTHGLSPSSPARNAGNPSISMPPAFDQRGEPFGRVGGGMIDIGAYEHDANAPLTTTDVIIKGTQPGTSTPWHESAWVSMNERIEAGGQFKSISTRGADQMEIQLSKEVTSANKDRMELRGTNERLIEINSAMVNPSDPTKVTITFDALLIDKYALIIFEDAFSELLDGEWDNEGHNGTLDDVGDDVAPAGGFDVGDRTAGGDFRLHFAYLPGDYNGSGYLDGVDDLYYLQHFIDCDGDGDGILGDTQDVELWEKYYAYYRDERKSNSDFDYDFNDDKDPDDLAYWYAISLRADFNGDNHVSGSADASPLPGDLAIWQANYGMTGSSVTHAHGDANYNDVVDGQDFLIWSQTYLRHSAWYIVPPPAPPTSSTSAPRVIDVIVSGSMSAHDPYHVPAYAGGGEQLRTVPVGLADTIHMVFDEDVIVTGSDLVVVGMRTANVPELAEFSYDTNTHTASWRYTGWVLADNFLLFLNDTVHNAEGAALDGEWTNPAGVYSSSPDISVFPSGDGSEGGAFAFVVTLLPGDISRDGVVNWIDQNAFMAYLQQGGGTLFVHGDFNGNGCADLMDITYLTDHWLMNLQNLYFIADFDANHVVDNDDLAVIAGNLGMTGANWEHGDVNGDGAVSELDLDLALAQWGLWLDMA